MSAQSGCTRLDWVDMAVEDAAAAGAAGHFTAGARGVEVFDVVAFATSSGDVEDVEPEGQVLVDGLAPTEVEQRGQARPHGVQGVQCARSGVAQAQRGDPWSFDVGQACCNYTFHRVVNRVTLVLRRHAAKSCFRKCAVEFETPGAVELPAQGRLDAPPAARTAGLGRGLG